ncbi:MAG TPA: ATP-binding protein [Solirubrobacteraceae bacterium]|nr:ATP-binding protein [Solirubrobacteraceae bacterium]
MTTTLELNPFRYGALALDEAFTDRERETAELKADALNGQDVVLFAPRRYGKSSLVWRVSQELVAEHALVAHVNLMRTPTITQFAEKLAQSIHEDIASPLFRAKERLRIFQGLRVRPTVTVDPEDGSLSFSFDSGPRVDDIRATLERLLELPGQLAGERKRQVVLIFDEFQEVVEIDASLPRLMRSVFQQQPEVAHLYLGSKRHMMQRIFNDENEPFWRSAKQVELDVIAAEPFAKYIASQFARTGKKIAPAAVDAILATTHGHPYATQELCYFLWQDTSARSTATQALVEEAIAQVLNSEHAHFSLVWESASAHQRLLLRALAEEQGRPLAADYRRRHALPGASSVQRALGALERGELVGRRGSEAWINEPFLARWLQLNEE